MRIISLELNLKDGGDVVVSIQNHSDNNINIWDKENSWGWNTLKFEIILDNQLINIERSNDFEWTRNSPSYISIPSKGIHSIAIDFNDGTWVIPKELKENEIENLRIKAIFEIQKTPEALEHNVFIGKVESDLIKVNVKNKIEFTNQE